MPKDISAFNLNALVQDAGHVILDDTTYPVKQLDGLDYHFLVQVAKEQGAASAEGRAYIPDMDRMYEIAVKALPGVPRERVLRLTGKQLAAVMAIAGEEIGAVEAMFPNGTMPVKTRRR